MRFLTSRTVAASCVSNPFRCINANATSREVIGSCVRRSVSRIIRNGSPFANHSRRCRRSFGTMASV
jgi:hypothetical protein